MNTGCFNEIAEYSKLIGNDKMSLILLSGFVYGKFL